MNLEIMKEILAKNNNKKTQLLKKLFINKKVITDQKQIDYKFFITIGPDLACKIPKPSKSFNTFMTKGRVNKESS